MNRADVRRQAHWLGERGVDFATKLFDLRPPLPAAAQQKPNAPAAKRPGPQPRDQCGTRDDATDADPRDYVAKLDYRGGAFKGGAYVRSAFAQRDEDDRFPAALAKHFREERGICRQ